MAYSAEAPSEADDSPIPVRRNGFVRSGFSQIQLRQAAAILGVSVKHLSSCLGETAAKDIHTQLRNTTDPSLGLDDALPTPSITAGQYLAPESLEDDFTDSNFRALINNSLRLSISQNFGQHSLPSPSSRFLQDQGHESYEQTIPVGPATDSRRLEYVQDINAVLPPLEPVSNANTSAPSPVDLSTNATTLVSPIRATSLFGSPQIFTPSSSTSTSKSTLTSASSPDSPSPSTPSLEKQGTSNPHSTRTNGPCSITWNIPRNKVWRGRQVQPKKRPSGQRNARQQCPRGPFQDETQRKLTALTRQLVSCIRCREHRQRCIPDPNNPHGECLTCRAITGPTIRELPCIRAKVTDASLYREQTAPYQLFTKRWQSWDLVDITHWASDEVRTVEISQVFFDEPYKVEVKEFIPIEGDMLDVQWMSGTEVKAQLAPRYAFANMEAVARTMVGFIESNIAKYVAATVGTSVNLFWSTYEMAFKQCELASTNAERNLLRNCFRLWMACRMTTFPEHICGDDKLGGQAVEDPASIYFGRVPTSVIMGNQIECINYARFLRPLGKRVLEDLQNLVSQKDLKYWLTIYLVCFLLLHNCAITTRRDEETARQYNIMEQFANPQSIKDHHCGANTLLAHYHWTRRNMAPFTLALTPDGLKIVREAAALTPDQAQFAHATAIWIKQERPRMDNVRRDLLFGDDFFWISQLYDSSWKPGPTV